MTTEIYFDLKDKEKGKDTDANTKEIANRDFRSLCKIHSDLLFLLQIHFKVTEHYQVSQRNWMHPL